MYWGYGIGALLIPTIVAGRVERQQQYTSHEYKQDEVQLLGPMNQFKDASMILNNTETSRY